MVYFNSQNFKKTKEKSFTLLEVLMAVFILTVAVGASYALFQKVFIASSLTQSKLAAYYLAQEGIENIRNIRDSNWLNSVSWADGISGQETEYVNFLDGSSSNFERVVSTSLIDEDTMEVKVNIKWNEKGRDYDIEAINNLYNWYGEELPEEPEEPINNTLCGDCQFWQSGNCVNQFYDERNTPALIATVQIGSQCWMKQSMNVGTRIDGFSSQGTNCSSIQKYCYENIDSNCTSNNPNYPDGGLYQWNQAMCGSTTEGVQGICPSGWHIPTDAEFKTLVEGQATPGCESSTGWQCSQAGTNIKPGGSSGFEGNLAGFRVTNGYFGDRGSGGSFWSSSQYSDTFAWDRYLYSDYATVARYYGNKASGWSVRCLKD